MILLASMPPLTCNTIIEYDQEGGYLDVSPFVFVRIATVNNLVTPDDVIILSRQKVCNL